MKMYLYKEPPPVYEPLLLRFRDLTLKMAPHASLSTFLYLMLGLLMNGASSSIATDAAEIAKPRWNTTCIILYIMCHDDASCHVAQQAMIAYPTITKIVLLPHTVFFESAIYREYLFYNFQEWKDKAYVGTMTHLVYRPCLSLILLINKGLNCICASIDRRHRAVQGLLFQKHLFHILDNSNTMHWSPAVIPLALITPNYLMMDQVNLAHCCDYFGVL